MVFALAVIRDLWRASSKHRIFIREIIPFVVAVSALGLLVYSIKSDAASERRKESLAAVQYEIEKPDIALKHNPVYGPGGRYQVFSDNKVLGVPYYMVIGIGGLFTPSALGPWGINIISLFLIAALVLLINGRSAFFIRLEIWYIIASSIIIFALAWIVAALKDDFSLFLPSRYTCCPIPFFLLLFIASNFGSALLRIISGERTKIFLIISIMLIVASITLTPALLTRILSSDGILQEFTMRTIRSARLLIFGLGLFSAFFGIFTFILSRKSILGITGKIRRNALFLFSIVVVAVIYIPRIGPVGIVSPAAEEQKLLGFISSLPKDIYLAGHPNDMNNIPVLAKRRVFVNDEVPLQASIGPARIFELFSAYYATSPDEMREFCDRHKVDYWVVNKERFPESSGQHVKYYYEPYDSYIIKLIENKTDFLLKKVPKGIKQPLFCKFLM